MRGLQGIYKLGQRLFWYTGSAAAQQRDSAVSAFVRTPLKGSSQPARAATSNHVSLVSPLFHLSSTLYSPQPRLRFELSAQPLGCANARRPRRVSLLPPLHRRCSTQPRLSYVSSPWRHPPTTSLPVHSFQNALTRLQQQQRRTNRVCTALPTQTFMPVGGPSSQSSGQRMAAQFGRIVLRRGQQQVISSRDEQLSRPIRRRK